MDFNLSVYAPRTEWYRVKVFATSACAEELSPSASLDSPEKPGA